MKLKSGVKAKGHDEIILLNEITSKKAITNFGTIAKNN
jgi:hypothetical protein